MVERSFTPPGECPVCGEDVPPGAKACPACGADERTGWNEDETRYDGLNLPDTAFDERSEPARKPWHQSQLWVGVALFLLILLLVAFLAG